MKRAGLAMALVLLAAGCGVSGDDEFRAIDQDEVPFDLGQVTTTLPIETTTTIQTGSLIPVVLWFVEGEGVRAVGRGTAVVDAEGLVDLLVAGPVEEDPEGLRTALPPDLVRSATGGPPTVTVDLDPDFQALAPAEQLLAVAQVVLTLTTLPRTLDVVFTVDGAAVGVPRGDGTIASGPVGATDYRALVLP